MKVVHLTYTEGGGAGRAALRLHHALRSLDTPSRMLVTRKASDNPMVEDTGPLGNFGAKVRSGIGQKLNLLQRTRDAGFRSPAVLPSRLPERVAQIDPDIVHLHWINAQMLAPQDLTRFRAPLVWTLHDMWAFCGTEHYTTHDRWKSGYTAANRCSGDGGLDLDRLAWQAKRKAWISPIHIVCPSSWLANCVQESALMRDWPVSVIPNPIDTQTWNKAEKADARAAFGLPGDAPLVLFGAIGGTKDPRKGADLLRSAIADLVKRHPRVQLAVFGQAEGPDLGAPTHYLGELTGVSDLRHAYSASDVFALPSRMDNLPNAGLEAMSCGTPVVAFRTCGVPDIVDHRDTGYLAEPFSTAEFAAGIDWLLCDPERHARISQRAVETARAKFDARMVARKYLDLYRNVTERAR